MDTYWWDSSGANILLTGLSGLVGVVVGLFGGHILEGRREKRRMKTASIHATRDRLRDAYADCLFVCEAAVGFCKELGLGPPTPESVGTMNDRLERLREVRAGLYVDEVSRVVGNSLDDFMEGFVRYRVGAAVLLGQMGPATGTEYTDMSYGLTLMEERLEMMRGSAPRLIRRLD